MKTIEELENRQSEIRSRITEINNEYAGRHYPEEIRTEWNDLGEELNANEELLTELRQRVEYIRAIAGEDDPKELRSESGAKFNTPKSRGGNDDIWDVGGAVMRSTGPEAARRTLNDNAKRALELGTIAHPDFDEARAKAHVERLIERFADDEASAFARQMLNTGSPVYRRAFAKTMAGRHLSPEESRAMSLSGSAGGYAVPYTLDPTIIPTSNSSVNPLRAISRIETIVGSNEWRGVSSGAITASYAAEGTEASDNSPTLAQPTANVERAQAYVPFSWEIGQDWTRLEEEMALLLSDAKDDLEATKFFSGAGHGSNEPEGLLTGATGTTAGGSATYAVSNLYALEESLAARFRPRAQFVANRKFYNTVRQLDTNGGANLWVRLPEGLANNKQGNTGHALIGYSANESTAMSSSLANGQTVAVLGDFRYFLIVDRIGMSVSTIPHIMGASGRPVGQSGLFAFWRNTSKVLSASAFKKQVQTA